MSRKSKINATDTASNTKKGKRNPTNILKWIERLPAPKRKYDIAQMTGNKAIGGGKLKSETKKGANEEDDRRIELLEDSDGKQSQKLADILKRAQDSNTRAESLSSSRTMRKFRKRIIGDVLSCLKSVPEDEFRLYTLIPTEFRYPKGELKNADLNKIKRQVNRLLMSAGINKAKGVLFGGTDIRFKDNHYDIHLHFVAAGGMCDVLDNLAKNKLFNKTERVVRPVLAKEVNGLPFALSYLIKSYCADETGHSQPKQQFSGASGHHRLKKGDEREYLIRRNRWSINDMMFFGGLELGKKGLRLTKNGEAFVTKIKGACASKDLSDTNNDVNAADSIGLDGNTRSDFPEGNSPTSWGVLGYSGINLPTSNFDELLSSVHASKHMTDAHDQIYKLSLHGRELCLSNEEVHSSGNKLFTKISIFGLDAQSNNRKEAIKELLQNTDANFGEQISVICTPGYVHLKKPEDGIAYYYPDGEIIGADHLKHQPHTMMEISDKFQDQGSLEAQSEFWDSIPNTSQFLTFLLGYSFLPYLQPWLEKAGMQIQNTILEVFGDTTVGKSRLLQVAASIGGGEIETWNSTNIGLSQQAVIRNNNFLAIDEANTENSSSTGSGRSISAKVFMYSSGKERASAHVKNPRMYSGVALSSSNIPLFKQLKCDDVTANAIVVRLLSIRLDTVFESLPDGQKSQEEALIRLAMDANSNQGHFAKNFIRGVLTEVNRDQNVFVMKCKKLMEQQMEKMGVDPSDGVAMRKAKPIAGAFVALYFAKTFGLVDKTKWKTTGQAVTATWRNVANHDAHSKTQTPKNPKTPSEVAKKYLSWLKENNPIELDAKTPLDISSAEFKKCSGIIKQRNGKPTIAIFPLTSLKKNFNRYKEDFEIMKSGGLVIHDKRTEQAKYKIGNDPKTGKPISMRVCKLILDE